MTKQAGYTLFVLIVGYIFGQALSGGTEVKHEVIHDTKTVTVTETETVEVPATLPDACFDLVKYANTISKAGSAYDTTTAGLLDIMSRLRIAVVESDTNAANDLETELRQLDSTTVTAAESLGESGDLLKTAAKECEAAVQ